MAQEPEALNQTVCSLCRSYQNSVAVLKRAKMRHVEWTEPKQYTADPLQDPIEASTLKEAFTGLYQTLSSASNHCKSYYNGLDKHKLRGEDSLHCRRYHGTQQYLSSHNTKSPNRGQVTVDLTPGTYMVSAGNWDTGKQQRHMVRILPGQTVTMDFTV